MNRFSMGSPAVAAFCFRWIVLTFLAAEAYALQDPWSYRLRLENRSGGKIEIVSGGKTAALGAVVVPANSVNTKGYRDSGRSPRGEVIATAANGLHIKVAQNTSDPDFPDGRGVLFSILPRELGLVGESYQSYKDTSSSIITDISAGTTIFAEEAPFVGSKVFIELDSRLKPLPRDYRPQEGDFIVIEMVPPSKKARAIEFENRFGGQVKVVYGGRSKKVVAVVYKPVMGTGRFDGSIYVGQSRVRANHHGVIDVSTVPRADKPFDGVKDNRGGFQIVPACHAMDEEMLKAREGTQWMVIGPPNATDPPIDGTAPLFRGYIRPSDRVECRIDGGSWEPLPELYGKLDAAFSPMDLMAYFKGKGIDRTVRSGLTHLRIVLQGGP